MELQEVLSQLREIHLPSPPGIWPLAIGWWVVASALIVGALYFIYRFFKGHHSRRAKKMALQAISRMLEEIERGASPIEVLASLSILLKRVALVYYPRQEVAGLTGSAWLQFLDRTSRTKDFTRGAGKILEEAPYKKTVDEDIREALAVGAKWIKGRGKDV